MKKLLGTFLFIMIMLSGCGNQNTLIKDIEFLTSSESWYHFNETTGENEKMSFTEDFTFSWEFENGNPVGNSNSYKLFDFNKESSVIRLYNDSDDTSMELEVLDYSDYHLLLKINGKIKDYAYSKTGTDIANSEKYIAGYSGEFAVLDGNTQEVVLGPFDYDGDEDYPENAIRTYKFSDDVKAYTLFTFTKIKNGKIVENTIDYEEISIKEAAYHMEYGGCGLVWFDDNLKVNKLLLYGATIAEE